MFVTVLGTLFIALLGKSAYDNTQVPPEPYVYQYTEEDDDKPWKEYWCDCEYYAKCEDGSMIETKVGYRGQGKNQAKRNACNTAKSFAKIKCLQKHSKLQIFAISGHNCPEPSEDKQ